MKMKMMMSRLSLVALCLVALGLSSVESQAAEELSVPIIPAKVQQRYPWNGLVDILLTNAQANAKVIFSAKDMTTGQSLTVKTLTLDGEAFTNGVSVVTNKSVCLVWDAMADVGENAVTANARFFATLKFESLYMVVDLSGGADATIYPVSYLMSVPIGGWTDEHKTTKIVLRWIEPGTFREADTRDVTLTKGYWMGVFEMTQKQYELIMGSNPSSFKGDARPVETISYSTIRGSASWPSSNAVSASSVLGKLRAKTGLVFDLPTEAQWEYACRAGTTGRYAGTGKLDDMGWYSSNSGDSTHGVGLKQANAWGLYDMHGNVGEWCLDWYGTLSSTAATDPKGDTSGWSRVCRGGYWNHDGSYCRSAGRNNLGPSSAYNNDGFRVACSAGQD